MRYGSWCALLVLVFGASAFSEGTEAEKLSKVFEGRIREVLERHLPTREFSVLVTATPSGKQLPNTPYVPKAGGSAFAQLSDAELDAYVSKLSVEVLVSKRLSKSQAKIQELIAKNFKIKPNRGDRVTFSALGIEVTSDEWERERNSLRQELNLAKAEAERLNRELQTAVLSKSAPKEDEAKVAPAQKSYLLYYMIGGLGAAVLAVMLFVGRSLAKAGESLGDAIGTIGEAMAAANSTTQMIMSNDGAKGGTQSLEAKTTIENKGGGMGQLPMESLYAHLAKMRDSIMDGYDATSESITVRHLNELLRNPALTGRGTALLEFLGPEISRGLYARIGLESQEAIKRFQREGSYPKSKIEMMMEAAEELKTKLMMESFEKNAGRPSDRVAEGIAQLSEDDLVQLVSEVRADLIPRLFLYFSSDKIAFFLERLKRQAPDKFASAVRVLPKMPEMAKVGEMDNEIADILKNVLKKTADDVERPFLKVYKEIVEASANDMRDEIVKALSTNARIKSYFAENIITLSTFFTLPENLKLEITEALSNKDYAALAAGAQGAEQEELVALMPERRKALITEEMETYIARGGQASAQAFTRVKDMVVAKIRSLKAEGRIPKAESKKAEAVKKAA